MSILPNSHVEKVFISCLMATWNPPEREQRERGETLSSRKYFSDLHRVTWAGCVWVFRYMSDLTNANGWDFEGIWEDDVRPYFSLHRLLGNSWSSWGSRGKSCSSPSLLVQQLPCVSQKGDRLSHLFFGIFTLWVGKKRTRCQRIIQRTCSSLPPAPIPAPCMEVSWGTILSTSPSGSLSLILTNLDPLTEILLFLILLPSVTVTPRHCWHCSPIYYQPEQTQSSVIFSVHSAPCALPSHRRL